MANNRRHKKKRPIKNDYVPPFDAEILRVELTTLGLQENTQNLLLGAGLYTIYDLVVREEKDFYRIHTFNKKALNDVRNALRAKKLYIKPTAPQTPAPQPEGPRPEGEKQQAQNREVREKSAKKERTVQRMSFSEELDAFVEGVEPERPPKPVKTQPAPEKQDLYVKINRGGKWGFRERSGKMVIEPVYDEVFTFHDDLCCVEKDEKFGFINRNGEIVIPIEYDCATSFSEGYALVYKRDKCGYINAKNEVVVDFVFDAGTPVIDGECRVKKDGKWGEMHLIASSDGTVRTGDIRWIT